MSDPELQIGLMRLLGSKHFPLQRPRTKVKIDFLLKLLAKIGCETTVELAYMNLNELKGQGFANTEPKILMRDEIDTAEFEIWLTPLGRTELQKRLAS